MMITHLLLLPAISYAVFVFIYGFGNPLTHTRPRHKKRQFELGRAAMWISIFSGLTAIVAKYSLQLNDRHALMIYLAIGCVLMLPSVVKYHRSALWK